MQYLQGPVEPAGGDAKVSLVRRHVVDAVMAAWQHYVPLLEKHHPRRQAKICVRPFMNLKYKDGKLDNA